MSEIVHAGIILRDDVENAEHNFQVLGPKDHPYLSERGGIGTTNALRAIGSAVPAGTNLIYRATDETIRHILVEDAKIKEGVPYSSMELGASLKGSTFALPDGLAERNTVSHILAVGLDKEETAWANTVTVDHCSDESERTYAFLDNDVELTGGRKKGPGATCSTFIVKGIQAAYGAAMIATTDHDELIQGHSRNHLSEDEKAREVYHVKFPDALRIDAKRNAPKTLQHLLETLEMNGEKMFERVGMLLVDEMAYSERKFDANTGEEIF